MGVPYRWLTLLGLATTALSPLSLHAAPSKTLQNDKPVALSTLASEINLSWQSFTLPNGLRVLVHSDHKSPVVGVSVWYHIGSKDEPAGKTGFAHLFEHLMFSGSENTHGDFFEPLRQAGGTDDNGTTWFDRTNYFETVPTPALDLALFLESDRMGHLLGGITQQKLDNQRGVVENEKRQGDNQPYGLVKYAQTAALTPEGHPYHHETIGSMADLEAASLNTVKDWFRQNYGPNNAVLVLAGDIDVDKAKTLVTRYFGDIPRGPDVVHPDSPIWTLPARKDEVLTDKVALPRLYRIWTIPGFNTPELANLNIAAAVLGGLSSSRLDQILVRQEQLAVSVTAGVQPFEKQGQFEIAVDVKPGVNPQYVSQRLDKILADYIAHGPSEDEVKRAATQNMVSEIAGLESVGGFGGQAPTLAEGLLYANDPDHYKKELEQLATATPQTVTTTLQKWLSRPVYALMVLPGERKADDELKGTGSGNKLEEKPLTVATTANNDNDHNSSVPVLASGGVDRSHFPAIGEIPDLKFPVISHAKLNNGIAVSYAQRTAVPLTRIAFDFDVGTAADSKSLPGTEIMMFSMLSEGTKHRNAIDLAIDRERLGASVSFDSGADRNTMTLRSPSANLNASLDLTSDILLFSSFPDKEFERVRSEQLASIAIIHSSPIGLASRVIGTNIYGKDHPYAHVLSPSGTEESVKQISRTDLITFKDQWLRPDKTHIFIVSDRPLTEILPGLNRRFGSWQNPRQEAGSKDINKLPQNNKAGILLINRPNSSQSVILSGMALPLKGKGDDSALFDLTAANDILGGEFLARLNMDLRETKGWSYGVHSRIRRMVGPSAFMIVAPVQTNQTGPSVTALKADTVSFLTDKGITEKELKDTITGDIRQLPGSYETGDDILNGMMTLDLYGRPDNYFDSLATRYRGLTSANLEATARRWLNVDKLSWVVVGDSSLVKSQLEKTGLPIDVIEAKDVK
ncbi:M16 family metallopeptidase [Zymomonas mobilis]|uniref:Peptidase M16 domain protein n=1 Tax=Zymomonas mobilis subsp. pomaceae (strain ATCC 29192 / DSM 22645 / JCM 10191 / CCUG 17912 / NBRC 13757 / NCIMB 11200 / NRRL B-4491 / Barker I) TaxID=579138 RepID=F8EWC3_ZYMMT|nr:pitrilysin family protein [Zymomonas mobilis]AEI38533.1 peptidase M16 domain protein [Zymomonas mobilis subsp. pomaceae ATCC 29192]MDX5948222.1 pitrilysin family protein [Zymomonas mobilis subsp. pomaceae]GEB88978.1 zinc protease [Zymomonas mobilis subsp. pomaceae]